MPSLCDTSVSSASSAVKGRHHPAAVQEVDPVASIDARRAADHSRLVRVILIAFGCMLGSWVVLVLLAARLPPGLMKDLAGFLPACVTTIRRLRSDPRVPRSAKIAVLIAMIWVISPIDLIPEFLPVIGPLDDVVVVALALRYAARRVPRSVILEAWPGDPRLIDRLLGAAREQGTPEPGSASY
jgi:uncharacterized membrane protein YkvA (DUF1232 family)